MLNVQDFQFDIKNIDLAHWQRQLQKHQDLFISLAIGVATLFFIMKITDENKLKLTNIETELSSLESKDKVISEYEKAKSELDAYIDSLPQGTTEFDSIINLINEFATLRNIQIQSFTPKGEKSSDYYDTASLEVSINTPNYTDLALFIKDIENSKYNLRIENWSITLKGTENRSRSPINYTNLFQTINVIMELSSLNFKK